jgi:hypothetical protein
MSKDSDTGRAGGTLKPEWCVYSVYTVYTEPTKIGNISHAWSAVWGRGPGNFSVGVQIIIVEK